MLEEFIIRPIKSLESAVPAGVMKSYEVQFKTYFKCALSSKCTCTFNLSDYSTAMRLALKQCANIYVGHGGDQ